MTLKATLSQIFSAHPNHQAVNNLVQICFRIALAYLHHRLRRGSLVDNQFGISNEDLALDCIAELYQRDEQNAFVVLALYFNNCNWETMSEAELKIALRRLVFSKVNEGLFRNYREEDPNLAKIIRNIKEATKQDKRVSLVKSKEASWLVIGDKNTAVNNLPLAPAEILEAHMLSVLCHTSNTYRAVSAFADFAKAHPHYCNGYPLSGFAQILRASFMGAVVPTEDIEESSYAPIEVEQAIQQAITHVRSTLYDTYVRGGKLSRALFDTYVKAVGKTLKSTFTRYPESVDSQFEALRAFIPDLSKETYMQQHRNVLQYLFKLSRARMIAYLTVDG